MFNSAIDLSFLGTFLVIYYELWKYVNWSGEEGIKTVKKTFANFDRYNLPQNGTKNSTVCTIVIMVVEFQVRG